MQRRIHCCLALLICLAVAPVPAISAEFTGYLNLTSDYVYRGVTRSDGHGAIQLGGDVAFESGFYAGVWGSSVDIGNNVTNQRDREVSYYVGYSAQVSDLWTIGGSIVAYRYPGSFGGFNYDHEEFSASINYDDRLWFEYSYAPDFYNSGVRTQHYELFAEWPLPAQLSLSAGVGHYDVAEFSGQKYTHWQLGLSRPSGRIDMDLRFHGTNRWVPFISDPERAKSRVVLSARFQF